MRLIDHMLRWTVVLLRIFWPLVLILVLWGFVTPIVGHQAMAYSLTTAIVVVGAVFFIIQNPSRGFVALLVGCLGLLEATNVSRVYAGWFSQIVSNPQYSFWQSIGGLQGTDFLWLISALVCGIGGAVCLFLSVPGARTALQKWSFRNAERKRSRASIYGSADWASKSDLETLGNQTGIILGQVDPPAKSKSDFIRYPLEAHALTCAPSRSGKGVLIATNLIKPHSKSWNGPVVVVDPKGESYFIAARRRKQMGRRPVLLDPFGVVANAAEKHPDLEIIDPLTSHFNPFSFIRRDERMVQDISVILDAFDSDSSVSVSGTSEHFEIASRTILGGLIEWVCCAIEPDDQNFGTLRALLSLPSDAMNSLLEDMRDSNLGYGLANDAGALT